MAAWKVKLIGNSAAFEDFKSINLSVDTALKRIAAVQKKREKEQKDREKANKTTNQTNNSTNDSCKSPKSQSTANNNKLSNVQGL